MIATVTRRRTGTHGRAEGNNCPPSPRPPVCHPMDDGMAPCRATPPVEHICQNQKPGPCQNSGGLPNQQAAGEQTNKQKGKGKYERAASSAPYLADWPPPRERAESGRRTGLSLPFYLPPEIDIPPLLGKYDQSVISHRYFVRICSTVSLKTPPGALVGSDTGPPTHPNHPRSGPV
jgi:hypothetical protein